jgi:hypothetical protein
MRTYLGWALGLSIASLATWGCHRSARQGPADGTTAVEPNSRVNRSAIRSIANARCEREQRCGNIGVDLKFATRDACLERVRAEWGDELNARECPGGVRDEELDECLEDVKGEDCGSPLDSLQRMLSCGTAEICSDA